jgi:hypothetical protein
MFSGQGLCTVAFNTFGNGVEKNIPCYYYNYYDVLISKESSKKNGKIASVSTKVIQTLSVTD